MPPARRRMPSATPGAAHASAPWRRCGCIRATAGGSAKLLGRGWNYRGEMLGFHGVVFQASSGMCVGGLQLRGATEWDEPGTFISSGVVSVADRAGPAIRPQPGRVSPGVTRRPRAVRSGQPLRAVRPKFLSASATCRISFEPCLSGSLPLMLPGGSSHRCIDFCT